MRVRATGNACCCSDNIVQFREIVGCRIVCYVSAFRGGLEAAQTGGPLASVFLACWRPVRNHVQATADCLYYLVSALYCCIHFLLCHLSFFLIISVSFCAIFSAFCSLDPSDFSAHFSHWFYKSSFYIH